ncbi:hypothetical protein Daus18300_011901 [Diaporthe australafricana]|uniref:Heterokaryon incompatibility domain-containing protein n=1 Tax=Diaporthe australafricana TaxID=127596 RepID=A0ABR3W4V1_9PEZI
MGTADEKGWEYHRDFDLNELHNSKVKIVDTANLDWSKLENKAYVTLSHKWGGNNKPARLTREMEKGYYQGIELASLPQTFQDAVQFALRVDDRVHYIWIDSLCIFQGDADDWLRESALMQDVYRNSFLNISATAAEHSGEGLYSHRNPQHLWEDMVRLNVDGLRYGADWTQNIVANLSVSDSDSQSARVRNCLLVDVSSWEKLVNQAPLHQRGWVVQERLLAPRVLHFCRGRVAWECAEFDGIEGHVPNVPKYELVGDDIYEGIPFKGLEPDNHGKRIRKNRLEKMEPTNLGEYKQHSRTVHSLELWARIVELYSRTDLTEKKDKLVALSGIANRMATIIEDSTPIRYIAGFWDVHLISQLLWHMEPVYRGDSDSRVNTLQHLSKRPTEYRAPSFSWASIDAQYGNGITCGHVLNSDSFLVEVPQDEPAIGRGQDIEVWEKGISVSLATDNKYGIVQRCHIRLWAWLHQVKLHRDGASHYYWTLNFSDETSVEPKIKNEKHFDVYLDCPGDDDLGNHLTDSNEIYYSAGNDF